MELHFFLLYPLLHLDNKCCNFKNNKYSLIFSAL